MTRKILFVMKTNTAVSKKLTRRGGGKIKKVLIKKNIRRVVKKKLSASKISTKNKKNKVVRKKTTKKKIISKRKIQKKNLNFLKALVYFLVNVIFAKKLFTKKRNIFNMN